MDLSLTWSPSTGPNSWCLFGCRPIIFPLQDLDRTKHRIQSWCWFRCLKRSKWLRIKFGWPPRLLYLLIIWVSSLPISAKSTSEHFSTYPPWHRFPPQWHPASIYINARTNQTDPADVRNNLHLQLMCSGFSELARVGSGRGPRVRNCCVCQQTFVNSSLSPPDMNFVCLYSATKDML